MVFNPNSMRRLLFVGFYVSLTVLYLTDMPGPSPYQLNNPLSFQAGFNLTDTDTEDNDDSIIDPLIDNGPNPPPPDPKKPQRTGLIG